jgi:hypothetical protein
MTFRLHSRTGPALVASCLVALMVLSNRPALGQTQGPAEPPALDLVEGLRRGELAAQGEGTGDGRMVLAVTNKTDRKLRVVLPPGLVAAGASGCYGGLYGYGGGIGGMYGIRSGIGGFGPRGVPLVGPVAPGNRTAPTAFGLMSIGRTIMTLTGDRGSWDYNSLSMGMMGGTGTGGLGTLGGAGGLTGPSAFDTGFRSVPVTGLPNLTLDARQRRTMPTRLVSLSGPNARGEALHPGKGERLHIGDIGDRTQDRRVQIALRRLAERKAPPSLAQLVMWHVADGLDWTRVAQVSRGWANRYELTLARRLGESLDESGDGGLPKGESAPLFWALEESSSERSSSELRTALEGATMLGLTTREGIPAQPEGPGITCRLHVQADVIQVEVAASDERAEAWVPVGKAVAKRVDDRGAARPTKDVLNEVAEGVLARLLDVRLEKGPGTTDRPHYRLKIANASPLVLNGIALSGPNADPKARPAALAGFTICPHRSEDFPVGSQVVDRLGLKTGVRLLAADLSGL